MQLTFSTDSIDDYRTFLRVKSLPNYRIRGRSAWVPDEYAPLLGNKPRKRKSGAYQPPEWMFDYQRDITALAIRKGKYAVFADCGLGKTAILLEFARHVAELHSKRCVLIVSPLMVVQQTMQEAKRFYGDNLTIEQIRSADLPDWLTKGRGIGITNYEALRSEPPQGKLACLILDESSILKSHYGVYGQECLRLGKGLDWKLCLTGTPAPNDRIEYANHAVFLDAFPTVNSFLATYFINRGQTDNRWELKPHALRPFYKALSHWSCFLSNPAVYGWRDNCENIPPILTNIHDVAMTDHQRSVVTRETGQLFATESGGITSRGKLGQIAKGFLKGESIDTNKPMFIKQLVESWPDESTLIWCRYDEEQKTLAYFMPEAASIGGWTKEADRLRIIDDFKAGRVKTLISKPQILGFGMNLQIATRMVFSSLEDSYEKYYQAVKRANRYGSTRPLNVHIPVTEIEVPMMANVLRKADRVAHDTAEQEAMFREQFETQRQIA